jgi:hypothetical protein
MEKGIGSLKQQIREETGGARRLQGNYGPRLEMLQPLDMRVANIAARKGISPGRQRMNFVKKIAEERGKVISDRDAKLFGSGAINIQEALSRAIPAVDMGQVAMERNMMQQEQLGFAEGGEASFPDLTGDGKVTQADILKGRGVFQEGGAVEGEIDKGLEELQGVAPEAMVIQQVMTMVMEMIQSGASEEQIVAALKEMGLDEEDIQQVMMMVAEQMQGQESIDGQLAQMM